MFEPERIYDDTGFFAWVQYEEQTRRKHAIVSAYFDRWVKILGKWNQLNCFDCFGGCGAYGDVAHPAYGSPILEAQCIDANRAGLNRDVRLIVIESNHDCIENMKIAFKRAGTTTRPTYVEGDFDNAINHILDETNLVPSFFFIDPFGFNIRYTTLKRIMQVRKSEMLINFMFNAVNQFLSADAIEQNLTALFGTDEWKTSVRLTRADRERAVHDLYRAQLKKLGAYVYTYPMSFEDKDRTYYYLFHVTNSALGCNIMKAVVATACDGYLAYHGPTQYAPTLFDSPAHRIAAAKALLVEHYAGCTLRYSQLVDELADSTPYLEKELHTAVKELEPSQITIKRMPNARGSKRQKNGVAAQDILVFRRRSL